jgi:HAD superfamily hydrolase (TIGR01490 family)
MTVLGSMPQRVAADLRVGAFFDVDNTLIPGAAIEFRFFRYLWARGLVGWREAVRSGLFLLRRVPPLSLQALRERKLYLTGKQANVIEPLAEAFVTNSICPSLSAAGLAVLRRHQESGHHLVLVTGSLDFLIEPLARFLKVEHVIAAQPERLDGMYTGHLRGPFPYGAGKGILMQSFAQTKNVDLGRSFAYGDSPGDVEALRLVGHPQVVNPIRGMTRIARQHGWPIAKWV